MKRSGRLSNLFRAAVLAPLLFAAPALAEQVPPEAQSAAISSLATLRDFSSPGNEKLPENLRLGTPVQDYMIGLDSLGAYSGGDAEALLRATAQIVYPVMSERGIETQITLAQIKGAWIPAMLGSPNEAKRFAEIAARVSAENGNPELFRVRIPALRTIFVGWRKDGELMLAPVEKVQFVNLETGKSTPAVEILRRLQLVASQIPENRPF